MTDVQPNLKSDTPRRGRPKGSKLSPEHVAAMQAGRVEGKAVEDFLAWVDTGRLPQRATRIGNAASVANKITKLDSQIISAGSYSKKLELMQRKADILAGKAPTSTASNSDVTEESLTAGFVEHGAAFALRKGISRSTFSALGVPEEVLDKAKIK